MPARAAIFLKLGSKLRGLARLRFRRTGEKCGSCGRIHPSRLSRRLHLRPQGVCMQGIWYCGAECLEQPLSEILRRDRLVSRRYGTVPHRVPLGLVLLSRQQLTAEQLRTALEMQKEAGYGKFGEWLQKLGYTTEQQITAALARQWSCPVLKTGTEALRSRSSPIPWLLLESFQMIPVEFAESRGAFLIAFSEAVDHTVLYAVEQMLGCQTEACFVSPSTLREGLQALKPRHANNDIVFERLEDAGECASIVGSYAAKIGAEQVRLARCGEHVWIRLERLRRETVNLVFHAPVETSVPVHSVRDGV